MAGAQELLPALADAGLSAADVETVVLTHIPATANPNDDYTRYAAAVKKSFSGQVLIAKDLMQF